MNYVVTAREMKEYDRDTIERIGIPSMVLMERAALGTVEAILQNRPMPETVLVVAGTGNNGGDGLAVGRLLALKGARVTFCLVGDRDKMTPETKKQLAILENLGFSTTGNFGSREYDMVVDALLGIGLSRQVTGEYLALVEQINRYREKGSYVCSVDIPSGICADTGEILGDAVKADLTVTFAFAKRGLLLYPGRTYAGKVTVWDIGITEDAFLRGMPGAFCYAPGDLNGLLPKRRPDGNKSTFGKVLLIAGSRDMSGACILSGKGILRSGAGMVKIVTPACNREIVQRTFPEAMLYTYEGIPEPERLKECLDWADVLVAGPGMGKDEKAFSLMQCVLADQRKPAVIDADGLNLIASSPELQVLAAERGREKLIMTPHPGELTRLGKRNMEYYRNNREKLVWELADRFDCIMAAKDAVTLGVQSGRKEIYINTSGNNGIATAGSGDILAGIIGGLLAQKMESFEAVCLGIYLHGLAGEEAARQKGTMGTVASDILEALPGITKTC